MKLSILKLSNCFERMFPCFSFSIFGTSSSRYIDLFQCIFATTINFQHLFDLKKFLGEDVKEQPNETEESAEKPDETEETSEEAKNDEENANKDSNEDTENATEEPPPPDAEAPTEE